MPSRVGMTGCSPTCIWVVSQDLLISSPTFPSAPIQEGIGCRGGEKGDQEGKPTPPLKVGSLNYVFGGSSSGY